MDKKRRLEFLKSVVALTKAKLTTDKIDTEYSKVELTGPAPGCAWDQHNAMVTRGLCKAAEENVERNRYSNLYPYDEKRVVLQSTATDETDYINASWIDVAGVDIKFILTMAPLHPASFSSSRRTDFSSSSSVSTCPEFWRMVQQTSASRILMICKLEAGYAGCSQYFPDSAASPHTHGAYTITLESAAGDQKNQAIIENRFRLAWEGEERMIEHLQFPFWPNYGVVQNLSDLADFVKKVHELVKESSEPLIVHCSGGIGRSGTFTTILSAYTLIRDFLQTGDEGKLETILVDGAISLQKIVTSLREQRHPWMVEGEHQYLLAYSTVICICDQLLDSVSDG